MFGLAFLILATVGFSCGSAKADSDIQENQRHGWLEWGLENKLDAVSVLSGGTDKDVGFVETLTATVDVDLSGALGWSGTVLHIDVTGHDGDMPNEAAGTLQGVDNAEVGSRRLRLYQAWIEKGFAGGRGNVRLGFSDLNAEFDVADSASALMAPSFGIGPEFGGTGSGGPSLYPSTALGLRLRIKPSAATDWSVSIVNAEAGVVGDEGGPDFEFDEGVLFTTEYAWTGPGRFALGYWRYSQDQDDIRDLDAGRAPVRRASQGGYAVAEAPVAVLGAPLWVFGKLGVSDGKTGDFRASWQAGLLKQPAFASRTASLFSIGVTQALLSRGQRLNAMEAGVESARTETQFEVTYADSIAPGVVIQPDLQYIISPSAQAGADPVWVAALRLIVGF